MCHNDLLPYHPQYVIFIHLQYMVFFALQIQYVCSGQPFQLFLTLSFFITRSMHPFYLVIYLLFLLRMCSRSFYLFLYFLLFLQIQCICNIFSVWGCYSKKTKKKRMYILLVKFGFFKAPLDIPELSGPRFFQPNWASSQTESWDLFPDVIIVRQ